MDVNEAVVTTTVRGLAELEELLRQGFFDGLVGQLKARYPNLGSGHVEDAVASAVEALVKRLRRGPLSGDARSYLAKIAYNAASKSAARAVLHPESPFEEQPDEFTPSAEDEALRQASIELIKAEVRSWENVNIREVTMAYIEAAVESEVVETDEVAEIVGNVVGEEINPNSVRTWKARGLRKLTEFAYSMNGFELRPDGAREDKE